MKKLAKLIGNSESITVEWKPSLSQSNEIVESVTAFANAEGGSLFIGISKNGEPMGVSIGKDTIENLTNRIAQHTEPKMHPRINVINVQDKEIIAIHVKESHEKPVLAGGKPYIRVGKSTRQMGKEEYESRILDKHKEKLRFDAQICEEARIKDIRPGLVKEFIVKAKQERGLDIPESTSVEEVLMRLKLMKSKKLTNAAILLFGEPEDFFPQCEIKCVRFKGLDVTGEMIDLKPINGTVIHQLRDAEKFIFDHIAMAAWIESGKLERQEKWEYPPKAIREALANAIAHRDYWSTAKVQVRIFDDRIEFWNPGKLPHGWTVQMLKKKHSSLPPNPLIAKQFFWLKYVEEVGTGTNKIIQWCREWGLPAPAFEYIASSLVVTLKKAVSVKEIAGTKPGPSRDQVGTKSGLSSDDIQKILIFCNTPKKLVEIMGEMNLSSRTKFRKKYINPLLQKKLLEMSNPQKPNSATQKYATSLLGRELIR
ncbi:MAG: putative DNA binding domain-containing protein [Candidatus Omnitrophica bacterium]|nr:putative DNA binding domain-containing protein [Candidatus Omnitrophota bacterium]